MEQEYNISGFHQISLTSHCYILISRLTRACNFPIDLIIDVLQNNLNLIFYLVRSSSHWLSLNFLQYLVKPPTFIKNGSESS